MSRFLNLRGYLILAAVVVALILVMSWCSDRARLKTMKAEATVSSARMGSAQDAIETIGENAKANTVTRAEVEDATNEIRSIQDPVERDRVARQRLCKLQARACP
jgi:membrane-bound lytic murein transglycosylase B